MLNYRERSLRKRLLASTLCGLMTIAGTFIESPVVQAQGFSSFAASGTVVDAEGKPIAGATVTVLSLDQGFTQTAKTSTSGAYTIPELRNGTYQFTVEAPDFDTYTESGITLVAGNAANQFRLVRSTGEITVTGRRVASVDFDLTTTGSVINVADVATRVPIARNLTALILQAPGTAGGSGAFNGLPSVNGGAVSENAYFVNGLNITDFRRSLSPVAIPFEFYQTLDVKTGGYAAEYGRSTGGFTSATTKSGSNDFHGGLLFTWNPNALRSLAPDTLSSDNDGGRISARSTIFQLSGPIWKDHLFFYGLYQTNDSSTVSAGRQYFYTANAATGAPANSFLGTSRSYAHTQSPFYAGKIDAVITDGQRLEFTYFNTSGNSTTDTFGDTSTVANRYNYLTNTDGPYSSRVYSRFGGENYVGRYTGRFAKWLTISAAYGRNQNISFGQNFNASNTNSPSVSDARGSTPVTLLIPGGGVTNNEDIRKFYRADTDLYFNILGAHHVKFGFDREDLSATALSVGGGGGLTYSIFTAQANDPTGIPVGTNYVTRTYYANGGLFTSRNDAFYIQDSWSLFANRLNFNLGIRNDRFTNKNSQEKVFYKSGDQWGPRIGFTIDPLGNQTDKIYGSFSRLYIPVAANTNIRLTGGESYWTATYLFNGLANNKVPILGAPVLYAGAATCPDTGIKNCDVTGDGSPVPVEAAVSRTLKPQSVDEYIVGYEKRLGSQWRIGAFFTYTKLNQVLEDAAIDAAVNKYCAANKITGCGDIWDGFNQYVLINPGLGATITLNSPLPGQNSAKTLTFSAADLGYPRAVRTYKAMTFEAHRHFDGIWSLDASYTYSKTIGNYEGGVKTDNGQTDTGLTTDFDQPGLTYGTFGYSPNDKRHVFKLSGSYLFFDRLNVGLNLQAYSPRRFGCIGTVPKSVDPYSFVYGAAGLYCQVKPDGSINTDPSVTYPAKLVQRGSVFQSDWTFTNDLDVSYRFEIGKAALTLRASVFNILNYAGKINYNEVGTTRPGAASPFYHTVTGYQAPRSGRLQLSFDF
ncbi:TonB-dependent receptor [Sphingomonas sp. GV3]|uniref:TonB-dependent receptor n=1 Tax=Sphingomonas sp. GV3 TaxID=3040671 RepID=UPI00280B2B54|nr:TonB-dependent receptor [Sphingomonas sp. GV3]